MSAQPDLSAPERADSGDPRGVQLRLVKTEIASLADPPADTADAYLRLHLLSARLVQPRTINLDGIFAVLPNNAWTSLGRWPRRTSSRSGSRRCRRASGCRCTASTSSRG